MLPRKLRLRRPEDFRAVRLGGKSWASGPLALSHRPNNRDHNRYGFVASKKLGTAVVRNRIKRRMRAAVRQRMDAHPDGYDIVVIARSSARSADFETLLEALARLEHRAGLIIPDENQAQNGS